MIGSKSLLLLSTNLTVFSQNILQLSILEGKDRFRTALSLRGWVSCCWIDLESRVVQWFVIVLNQSGSYLTHFEEVGTHPIPNTPGPVIL